jgi:hypothetical protein
VQVFIATGHSREAVKFLEGKTMNFGSRLGKRDPQLILSMLIESLEASEDWDDALRVCLELLSNSEYQSEDRIWTLWLKARSKSTDPR